MLLSAILSFMRLEFVLLQDTRMLSSALVKRYICMTVLCNGNFCFKRNLILTANFWIYLAVLLFFKLNNYVISVSNGAPASQYYE